jgi:hypothetical protein
VPARLLLFILVCALAASVTGAAPAAARPHASAPYGWPVRPFDVAHPIRGNFGDPRTAFLDPLDPDGSEGPGAFSFHNGVDIAVPDGTSVYPVVSGRVRAVFGDIVSVGRGDGRTFRYEHIVPVVERGERVVARQSLLGYVRASYAHVHLAEIDGMRVVNPLEPRHLTPYADHTAPRIAGVEIRAGTTLNRLDPLRVCGRVSLIADAFDLPSLPIVLGPFAGAPVTPALVRWELRRVHGGVVVPLTSAADFRHTLPLQSHFWNVYARGTYQNSPRFGGIHYASMRGRYLFHLASDFDTRSLGNGAYLLMVHAGDARGNSVAQAHELTVENVPDTATGCPAEDAPEPPSDQPPSSSP